MLAFADKVAAAVRSHERGVNGVCRHVTTLAGAVGFCGTIHRQGKFTCEDDVCGFGAMGMVGIARMGSVFPNVSVGEAFALELGDEFVFVHAVILQKSWGCRDEVG